MSQFPALLQINTSTSDELSRAATLDDVSDSARLGEGFMHRHRRRTRITAAANVIAAVLGLLVSLRLSADEPRAPPQCAMRLAVQVTPDVPNPADGGFISSLLGDHPGYHLFVLQVVDNTNVILQLQGPGSRDRCQAVVDGIRNDGRVESIQVN